MPFGLKNARVTYQRLVNHMFRPQIGRNIEAYGDDMFVTNETLYNRGFSQPYLRCLTPDESHYILRDVHEGACRNHPLSLCSVGVGHPWSLSHGDETNEVLSGKD